MFFNSMERKGVLILLFLITGILVIPRQLRPKEHPFFLLQEMVEVEGDSLWHIDTTHTRIAPIGLSHKKRTNMSPVDLNTADSSTLVRIKGIGPYYATKILRYRERLGGYYAIEQLQELNMTYFNVDSNTHLFTVELEYIVKRDLDSMDFKAILKHPYLEYEDVELIFDAKRRYGHVSYTLLEEKKVLPIRKLKKIKPYFR